jgi:Transmembrane domain of unknown function (DUF3566)
VMTPRSTGDDQGARTSDIMAPPRQQPRKPAPAKSASPDDAVSDGRAGGGVSPNGAPAGGKEDTQAPDAQANGGARPAADETVVDGVPALPADTIGSSRSAKFQAADPAPAESAVKPTTDPVPPGPVAPAPAPGSALSSAAADPPLSPAAFAWEMPDPPPSSPSSPARTFLRSGTTSKNPAAPPAEPPARPAAAAAGPAAAARAPTAARAPAAAGGPAQPPTRQRGSAQKAPRGRQKRTTARQAHLTIARVEPWSVMKFSFVVSLVAFVILFVAVSVLYGALAGLGVFDSLQRVVSSVTSSQGSAGVNAKAWFSASRVLGYTALLGSLNIVLITAMSTIGAVVYNLTSRLVGGVEVTLRETE